jgi:predicted DsbA family dithiol-disulfide isomerase
MIMKSVERLAGEANLELKMPPRLSNSKLALEIAEYAKEKGKFEEFHNEVFRAYWLEGKDIGDPESLFTITKEISLDTNDLKKYLSDGKAHEKIEKYLGEIRDHGLSGVPTFIIGDKIIVGAQPYEVLKEAVENVLAGC